MKLLLVFCCFFILSCQDQFDADPLDPRLPIYSESGKNQAGAFVDGEAWLSVPCSGGGFGCNFSSQTIRKTSTGIELIFTGSFRDEFGNSTSSVSMGILIDGIADSSDEELLALDGVDFDLGSEHVAYYENCLSSNGELHFRKIRRSQTSTDLIISGTFGFIVNDSNCSEVKVTQGRFDFRM